MTERLGEVTEWEPNHIETRQREMAGWASSVWKF
jgi:hypothetical protein